jgi:hypothetical protein
MEGPDTVDTLLVAPPPQVVDRKMRGRSKVFPVWKVMGSLSG